MNREQRKVKRKAYYEENKERMKAYGIKYYAKRKEQMQVYCAKKRKLLDKKGK